MFLFCHIQPAYESLSIIWIYFTLELKNERRICTNVIKANTNSSTAAAVKLAFGTRSWNAVGHSCCCYGMDEATLTKTCGRKTGQKIWNYFVLEWINLIFLLLNPNFSEKN